MEIIINISVINTFLNYTDINSINTIYKSNFVLEFSRKINIFATIIVLAIGFVGNSLVIIMFGQKKFRLNSSNVYLLCLALIDTFFLVIHIFEDTIRTIKDIYFSEHPEKYPDDRLTWFVDSINILDGHNWACRLINYLRYVLRFISAYIIVVFTIQRVIIIYSPLKNYFNSKRSAWNKSINIILISFLLNLWVPFIFHIKKNENDSLYCDVKDAWRKEYFLATFIYIFLIMFVPIITILVSNSLILISTINAEKNRKSLQLISTVKSLRCQSTVIQCKNRSKSESALKLKPFYYNAHQYAKKVSNRNDNMRKLTKILTLISSSYALLNIPYLITWSLFFYKITFTAIETSTENYLFAAVKLSEIFYLLNYSLKFYLYCAMGSTFRNHLEFISE